MRDIVEWRNRIDEIDTKLLALLNERAKCALEIGHIKRQDGLPVLDAGREQRIYARLRELNGGPFSNEAIERLFSCLIAESRLLESRD